MDIDFYITDSESGQTFDVKTLVSNIEIFWQLSEQAGRMTFDIIIKGMSFSEGSAVQLYHDSNKIFKGYVIAKQRKDDYIASVTAYDTLFYLKSQQPFYFEQTTASERFSEVCGQFGIQNSVVHSASYNLSAKAYDNQTLSKIIQDGIDQTLAYTGKWYILRDNFGTIEFLDLEQLKTDLVVGEASLMSGFDYKTDIEDAYNQVKLGKDNNQTNKRDVYIVKDSDTIRKWGLLQWYDTVGESANPAQIEEKATMLLKLKNRVNRTLSIDAIGDWRVRAGNSIFVVKRFDDMSLNRFMLVHSVKHKLRNKEHIMTLSLQVVE